MGIYTEKFLSQPINTIQEQLRNRSDGGENINLKMLIELESNGKKRRTLLRWLEAVSEGKISIQEDLTPKTKSGYPLDEVVSALQKSIRRCMYEEACFWARELAISGNGWKLWRRLQIIALEDIGMANPMAIVVIRSLKDHAMEFGVDTWEGQRAALEAAFFLASSPSSRLMDELLNYFDYLSKDKIKAEKPEVPEYARDCHTRAGRRLGFVWDHKKAVQQWYSEASLLENEVEIVSEEKKYLKALMVADGFIDEETSELYPTVDHRTIIEKIKAKVKVAIESLRFNNKN